MANAKSGQPNIRFNQMSQLKATSLAAMRVRSPQRTNVHHAFQGKRVGGGQVSYFANAVKTTDTATPIVYIQCAPVVRLLQDADAIGG